MNQTPKLNILVTGCLGFIGSNLVPLLLNQGHRVIGFDNFSNVSINPTDRMKKNAGKNWRGFKFYNCDVTSFKFIHSLCTNETIDVIIHLAAMGSVPRSFDVPRGTFENNVLGFTSVAQLAATLNIKRIVFASSSSVYGSDKNQLKLEGREGELLSPYAISKKMNEDFARVWLAQFGVEYVGLRFFNVYGPGQLMNSKYSALIPKIIHNEEPIVYGDGTATRDFTFVEDVCMGISHAVTGKTFNYISNLAKGTGDSINDVMRILDKKPIYDKARQGDIENSCASTAFCMHALGYVPQTTLADGLAKTKEYYDGLRDEQSKK